MYQAPFWAGDTYKNVPQALWDCRTLFVELRPERIAEVQMYRLPVDRHIFEGEETMILENPYSEKKLSLLQC